MLCPNRTGSNQYPDRPAVNGTVTFTSNGNLNPSATGILVNSASIELPPGMNDPNTVDNLALDTDTLTPRVSWFCQNRWS
jgi:hypothetical protein